MISQCIMQPSIVCTSKQLDPRCNMQTYHAPISQIHTQHPHLCENHRWLRQSSLKVLLLLFSIFVNQLLQVRNTSYWITTVTPRPSTDIEPFQLIFSHIHCLWHGYQDISHLIVFKRVAGSHLELYCMSHCRQSCLLVSQYLCEVVRTVEFQVSHRWTNYLRQRNRISDTRPEVRPAMWQVRDFGYKVVRATSIILSDGHLHQDDFKTK